MELLLRGSVRVLHGAVVEVAVVEHPAGDAEAQVVQIVEAPVVQVGVEFSVEFGVHEVALRDDLADTLAGVGRDLRALRGHRALGVSAEPEAEVPIVVEVKGSRRPGCGEHDQEQGQYENPAAQDTARTSVEDQSHESPLLPRRVARPMRRRWRRGATQ